MCGIFILSSSVLAQEDYQPTVFESVEYGLPTETVVTPVRLFPSNIEEQDFGERRNIIRTYTLSENDDPTGINEESFEQNGFYYTLQHITTTRQPLISTQHYTTTIEIETESSNINTIVGQLSEYIEHKTADGYSGILILNLSSINTHSAGNRTERFTRNETRTFDNLSNPDASLVPQSITVSGSTLTLSNINWNPGSFANTFTATVTYTGQGTRNIPLGYITVAEFSGELTRISEGEIIYTALFAGTPLVREDDVSGSGADDGGSNYVDSESEPTQPREPIAINLSTILLLLAITGILGVFVWFFFIRGNIVVFTIGAGEKHVKIGRAKVSKRNLIVDLSSFASKTTTAAFKLDIAGWTASYLNGETITVNYGGQPHQHIIAYKKGQGVYSIDLTY